MSTDVTVDKYAAPEEAIPAMVMVSAACGVNLVNSLVTKASRVEYEQYGTLVIDDKEVLLFDKNSGFYYVDEVAIKEHTDIPVELFSFTGGFGKMRKEIFDAR